MPLPSKSNPISFSQLAEEFGDPDGNTSISLSEYYGSGYKTWPTPGVNYYAVGYPNGEDQSFVVVPHAGEEISLNRFYSASRTHKFNFVIVGGGGAGGPGWPDNIGGGGGGGGGGGVTFDYFDAPLKGFSATMTIGAGGVGAEYSTQQSGSGGTSTLIWRTLNIPESAGTTRRSTGGEGGWGWLGGSNSLNVKGGNGGLGTFPGNAGATYGGNTGPSGGTGGNAAGGGGAGIDDQPPRGAGGNGVYISALNLTFGGGGGGGGDYTGNSSGGTGGGGSGASATSGTAGTNGLGGGGGGGGSWNHASFPNRSPGLNGGSGVIWVYYPKSYGKILSGGIETNNTSYYFHQFLSNGTLTSA